MKKMTKVLKGQDGFTLVELMVVVAIIGLLSAVAIPNFKKYQAKARTSEAKLQLAAIYTAQASFFSDFNIYATCLAYMGYDPTLEASSRYYTTGFHTVVAINGTMVTQAEQSGLNTTACPVGSTNTAAQTFFPGTRRVTGSVPANVNNTFLSNGTIVATNGDQANSGALTYLAGAAGFVSTDAASAAEVAAVTGLYSFFTINQLKKIETVKAGF